MNDEDLKMQEQLSALADGQLHGEEFAEAMEFAETDNGLATWQVYHLIGDVMRSTELARPVDMGFVAGLRVQLATEQGIRPVSPRDGALTAASSAPVAVPAANASVFQWKLAAGFASLAAVAAIGWHAYSGIGAPQGTGPELAAGPAAISKPQDTAVASAESSSQPVMIRDPRLDELLAAHRQFGSTSSLQMPAGFLRNATFEAPAR